MYYRIASEKDPGTDIRSEYENHGGIFDDGTEYEKAYLHGLMLHNDAKTVVDTFNMLSNKIAMVVNAVDTWQEDEYSIPVTFTRFKSGILSRKTRAWAWETLEMHEFDVKCQNIITSDMSDISHIVFIDPCPGRKARSKKGLYPDVLQALKYQSKKL